MSEKRNTTESPVRTRGGRLWRVLVVSGMAIGAACAGAQRTDGGSSTGSAAGNPNGMNPGPGDGHGHGSGAGGW